MAFFIKSEGEGRYPENNHQERALIQYRLRGASLVIAFSGKPRERSPSDRSRIGPFQLHGRGVYSPASASQDAHWPRARLLGDFVC